MPGHHITDQQAHLFMVQRRHHTQAVAAAKAGISERSARRIEKDPRLPSQKKRERHWRTRPDPLEQVWSRVEELLKIEGILAVTIFETVQDEFGEDAVPDGVRRTLERRIARWRALNGGEKEIFFPQRHEIGRQGLSDFTVCDELRVTIAGKRFDHRLFHFCLAHSGWEHAAVVLGGESFSALSEHLQDALWKLGGVPAEHRSDSLSAAYKNLDADAQRDFTRSYEDLCRHYGMCATRNNRGEAHENGSIESPNGHLKRRLDQALRRRDTRDFASIEDYRRFVEGEVAKQNRRRAALVDEERRVLKALPARRTTDFTLISADVTRNGTVSLDRVTYSVPSRLVGRRLHAQGREQLGPRDVLVVDEAGMIGSRQMERVLSQARDAGAKVVMVGDPEQLQAIEAGAAFRSVTERHGAAEITEIRRQREDWQRDATRALATGRTGEAIYAYDGKGMVHAADTREQARGELVDGWDRARQAEPSKSRIILTHTNAEVQSLNGEARDRLRASGDLGDDVTVKAERGERQFATGDRIMFLRNERGMGVKNGTLATIERVSAEGMAVRFDDGRGVAFDTKDYAHVDHGYAATFHKSQGVTVDRAHVLATPGMDRHSAYVGMSRHRDGAQLHYGRDDFADQRQLVRALSRERGKDMAGDYARPEQEQARAFADRREIRFPELARQVVEKVRDKAKGMFAGFKPKSVAERASTIERGDAAIGGKSATQAKAIERYARVTGDIGRMREKGLPVLPHQESALNKAGDALDAARPHAARDLASALARDPKLIEQAASGNTGGAARAMAEEQRVRLDPDARADRFVSGWQRMQQMRAGMERAGDSAGAQQLRERMEKAASGLHRDPQLESALHRRAPELALNMERGRSIGDALASSLDRGRDRDRGMSR